MKQHYKLVRDNLSYVPRTTAEIAGELFPRDKGVALISRRDSVRRSLKQLNEDGLAEPIRLDNRICWGLPGIKERYRFGIDNQCNRYVLRTAIMSGLRTDRYITPDELIETI